MTWLMTVDIGCVVKGVLEPTKEAEIDESELIRNSAFIRVKPVEEPIEEIEDDEVLKQLPDYYFDASPEFDIQFHLLKVACLKFSRAWIQSCFRTYRWG